MQVHDYGQQQWHAGTIGGLAAACRFSLLLLRLPETTQQAFEITMVVYSRKYLTSNAFLTALILTV